MVSIIYGEQPNAQRSLPKHASPSPTRACGTCMCLHVLACSHLLPTLACALLHPLSKQGCGAASWAASLHCPP